MQFLFNIVTMALVMVIGLLVMHVDRLSYEVAKSKAAQAYQVMQSAKPESRQQAEIESNRLMGEARALCAGAFMISVLSISKNGPCSDLISETADDRKR